MSDVAAAFRLARAGWIMVREGVVAALPGDQLSGLPKLGWRIARLFTKRKALRRGRSDRLAAAIARLGPSYVKLGQFLATRPDVVGNDIALDLALLQDRMETFPMAEAVAAIEGSLGRPVGELFLSLGEPVAAASIAQVHPAEVDPRRRDHQGRGQGDPPRRAPALSRMTSRAISSPRACRSATSPPRAGCVRSR